MGLEDKYDIEKLRNRTMELVLKKIEKLMEERDDFCKCENCILDLIAYTLNHVKPFYMTSLLGPLDGGEKEKRIELEIDLAINGGLKRIKEHPHHEDNKNISKYN